MKGHFKKAFTLVELMVVVLCLMLVISPAMRILQQGSSSSLSGMLQIETTLEGRRIIRQVHNDLKMACLLWDTPNSDGTPKVQYVLADMYEKKGESPFNSYSFYCFPHEGLIEESVANMRNLTEPAPRLVSEVTYKLDRPNLKEPMRLIREEKFHPSNPIGQRYSGGIARRVLSTRVNVFSIQIRTFQDPGSGIKDQALFWVTLQLKEGHQRPDIKSGSVGEIIRERSRGMIVADFYDAVNPEFFHSFCYNPGTVLSWYSQPQGP
ncbi:prepilin-type N-terminal cleavage/methylation domain-containing protein [bacterium]|nr:prepilin-type N-terminal cleavage/methylation domain-containing protein [bacterium]